MTRKYTRPCEFIASSICKQKDKGIPIPEATGGKVVVKLSGEDGPRRRKGCGETGLSACKDPGEVYIGQSATGQCILAR